MDHERKIKWSATYGALVIIHLVFFAAIYKAELNFNILLASMGMSLLVLFIIWSQSKGKLHWGNSLGTLGLVIVVEAGLPLVGNLYMPALDKEVWWTIEDQQIKTMLGLATIVGLIMFFVNIKAMIANWIFMRPFGKGKF